MSKWIRVDRQFGGRIAVLRVDQSLAKAVLGAVEVGEDPQAMADSAARLVEKWRPDLKGVVVEGIGLDLYQHCLQFQLSHPSFAPVKPGQMAPELEILISADEPHLVTEPAHG